MSGGAGRDGMGMGMGEGGEWNVLVLGRLVMLLISLQYCFQP